MAYGARPELVAPPIDKNKIPITAGRIDALKVFLGDRWRE